MKLCLGDGRKFENWQDIFNMKPIWKSDKEYGYKV